MELLKYDMERIRLAIADNHVQELPDYKVVYETWDEDSDMGYVYFRYPVKVGVSAFQIPVYARGEQDGIPLFVVDVDHDRLVIGIELFDASRWFKVTTEA